MKNEEKRIIAILVAITVVVIIIAIIMSNSGKKAEEKVETEGNSEPEISQVLEDGTILNNSDKLHQTKKIEEMEITNIQLTEKDDESILLGTVTNTSETKQGGYVAEIKLLDKEGNEIKTIEAYIGEIQPGKSMKFSTSATFDSTNVYDFSITKK